MAQAAMMAQRASMANASAGGYTSPNSRDTTVLNQEEIEVTNVGESNPKKGTKKGFLGSIIMGRGASNKSNKKPPRRLTYSELSGVFRRLDTNGDGELTFDEFGKIARKLKLRSENLEEKLIEVFNDADEGSNTNQALDISEFRIAYNKLYTQLYCGQADEGGDETFIKATRYGTKIKMVDSDGSGDLKPTNVHVFEVYMGTSKKITQRQTYKVNDMDSSRLSNLANVEVVSMNVDLTIRQLNTIILADNETNALGESSLLWWVDFCTRDWSIDSLNNICPAMGIPESAISRIMGISPEDRRVNIDRGDITKGYTKGRTGVCSMYVQSLCIRNIPIVKRDPKFVRDVPLCGLLPYLSSRLIHFNPWVTGFFGACKEYRLLATAAENDLEVLWDDNDVELPNDDDDKLNELPTPDQQLVTPRRDSSPNAALGSKTVISQSFCETAHFTNIPLQHREIDENVPMYLLSSSDIKQRPVNLESEAYSTHIIDHGSGPMVLCTFRKCKTDIPDPATEAMYSFEQQTRAGVLGRITVGIWRKLLEVVAHNGTCSLCGHLTDSSFALAQLLITMIHSSSLQTTIQRLEQWGKELNDSVEEIAVTKHARHIDILMHLLEQVKDYVTGFNDEIEPLLAEFQKLGGAMTTRFESSLLSEQKREPFDGCVELQLQLRDLQAQVKLSKVDEEFVDSCQETLTMMHSVYFANVIESLASDFNEEDAKLVKRKFEAVKEHVKEEDRKRFASRLEELTGGRSGGNGESKDDDKPGAGAGANSHVHESMNSPMFKRQTSQNVPSSTSSRNMLRSRSSMHSSARSSMQLLEDLERMDTAHLSELTLHGEEVSVNKVLSKKDSTDSNENGSGPCDALTRYCGKLSSTYVSPTDISSGHTSDVGVPIDYSQITEDDVRYELFKSFTSRVAIAAKNVTISVDLLTHLTRGYPPLDPIGKEGTLHWQKRAETAVGRLEALEERYQRYLDEKRNFWSFMLGIVSIATFPFAVMTGYFGMNFENMAAPGHVLTNDYWPTFPGSDLIWILTIIVYSFMLAMALHYQVFYAAS